MSACYVYKQTLVRTSNCQNIYLFIFSALLPLNAVEATPDRGLANSANRFNSEQFVPSSATVTSFAPYGLHISIPRNLSIYPKTTTIAISVVLWQIAQLLIDYMMKLILKFS